MTARVQCPHCGGDVDLRVWLPETREGELAYRVTELVHEQDRPVSARKVAELAGRRQADVRTALARAEREGHVRRTREGRWTT